MEVELPVKILRQPDYTTCGPTSLHAVYDYFGDDIPLPQVIDEINKLEGGGTVSVHLALHALERGYEVDIWTCNVKNFDPTWFQQKTDLYAKAKAQVQAKGWADDPRYTAMLQSFGECLRLGLKVHWGDLTPRMIGGVLKKGVPILTGTNGTYLYQCIRETAAGPDDVAGVPFGHFLVVCGYSSKDHQVSIADPLRDNPLHNRSYYRTSVWRLIGAIFLGSATDDSNFLVIRPKGWRRKEA